MSEQDCKDESHILGTSKTRSELQTFSTSETPKIEITKVDCTFKKDHICGWKFTGDYYFLTRGVYISSKLATIKSPEIKSNQLERCLTVALSGISSRSQIFIRLINATMEYVVYKNSGRNVPTTGVKVDLTQFGDFRIKIVMKGIKISSVSLSELNCQNERHFLETATTQFEHTTELTKSLPNTSTKHTKFVNINCAFQGNHLCGWKIKGKYYLFNTGVHFTKLSTLESQIILSNNLERCLVVMASGSNPNSLISIKIKTSSRTYVSHQLSGRQITKFGVKTNIEQFGSFKIILEVQSIKIISISLNDRNCLNQRHILTESTSTISKRTTSISKPVSTTATTKNIPGDLNCVFKNSDCSWKRHGVWKRRKGLSKIRKSSDSLMSPIINIDSHERCLVLEVDNMSSRTKLQIDLLQVNSNKTIYSHSGYFHGGKIQVNIKSVDNFKLEIIVEYKITIKSVKLNQENCQGKMVTIGMKSTKMSTTGNGKGQSTTFKENFSTRVRTHSYSMTSSIFTTKESQSTTSSKSDIIDCVFKGTLCNWKSSKPVVYKENGIDIEQGRLLTVTSPFTNKNSNEEQKCLVVKVLETGPTSAITILKMHKTKTQTIYRNHGKMNKDIIINFHEKVPFKIRIFCINGVILYSASLLDGKCSSHPEIFTTTKTQITTIKSTTDYHPTTQPSPSTVNIDCVFKNNQLCDWKVKGKHYGLKKSIYFSNTATLESPTIVSNKYERCLKITTSSSDPRSFISIKIKTSSSTKSILKSTGRKRKFVLKTDIDEFGSFKIILEVKRIKIYSISFSNLNCKHQRHILVASTSKSSKTTTSIIKPISTTVIAKNVPRSSTVQSSMMTSALTEEYTTSATTKSVDLTTKSTTDYHPTTQPSSSTINIDCVFKNNQLCDWKVKGKHYGLKKSIYFSNTATLDSPTIVSNKYERCLKITTSSSDSKSFISIKIKTSSGSKSILKSTGRKRNFVLKTDIDEFGSFKIILEVKRINIFSISFSGLNCKHQRHILVASTSKSSKMTSALTEELTTSATTKSFDKTEIFTTSKTLITTTESTTDYNPTTQPSLSTATKSTTDYHPTTQPSPSAVNIDCVFKNNQLCGWKVKGKHYGLKKAIYLSNVASLESPMIVSNKYEMCLEIATSSSDPRSFISIKIKTSSGTKNISKSTGRKFNFVFKTDIDEFGSFKIILEVKRIKIFSISFSDLNCKQQRHILGASTSLSSMLTSALTEEFSTTSTTKSVDLPTESTTDTQPSTEPSSTTATKYTTDYLQTTETSSTTENFSVSKNPSTILNTDAASTSTVSSILTRPSTKTKYTTDYQPSTKRSSNTDPASTSASSLPARPSTTVTLTKTSQPPKNVTSFVPSTSHPTENKETIKSTNTLPELKETTVLNTTMQKSETDASSSPTNATMKQVSTTPNLLKFTTSVTKQHYTTMKETSYKTHKSTENGHTKETIVTSKQRSTNSKFITSTEPNNLFGTNGNNQNAEKSASSDTSKNLHLGSGEIAGIVVGVVALLVIIVFVANYVHRQRNNRKLRNELYIEDKLRFENPLFEHMDDEGLNVGPFGESKA